MRIKNSPGQSGRRHEFGYRPRQTWLGTVYAAFNKGLHKGLHAGLLGMGISGNGIAVGLQQT